MAPDWMGRCLAWSKMCSVRTRKIASTEVYCFWYTLRCPSSVSKAVNSLDEDVDVARCYVLACLLACFLAACMLDNLHAALLPCWFTCLLLSLLVNLLPCRCSRCLSLTLLACWSACLLFPVVLVVMYSCVYQFAGSA